MATGLEPCVIGRKVKYYRYLNKMSQHTLSQLAGIPQGYISRLENGHTQNIYLTHGYALAKGLGVTVEDLMTEDED